MGTRDCLSKAWNRGQLVFILLFLVDLVCLAAGALQPFRALRSALACPFLRPYGGIYMVATTPHLLDLSVLFPPRVFVSPWMLLCRQRSLRRVYQAIFHTLATLLKMFSVVVLHVAFFAGIAIHVFGDDYNQTDTYVEGRDGSDFRGAFNHLVRRTAG